MAVQGNGKCSLKKAILTFINWAKKNGMALNMKKCGIMIHKGSLKLNTQDKQKKCYLNIPITEEYKYLGIWIDRNVNLKKQILSTKDKLKKS